MTKRYQRWICMVAVLQLSASPIHSVSWTHIRGSAMKDVSIGDAGVWAVTTDNKILYSRGSYQNQAAGGHGWQAVDGPHLKQVDVGRNVVWGVTKNDDVVFRAGISPYTPIGMRWRGVGGQKLRHVSVSDRGHVWGVSSEGDIYRREGASCSCPLGRRWQKIPGSLKQLSVGFSGVWGVDARDAIFYRTGTYGDPDSKGTGWEMLDGRLKYVSSGLGVVIGTSKPEEIFTRHGVSVKNPKGSGWTTLNGRLRMVDGYDNALYWGVTSGNEVYRS